MYASIPLTVAVKRLVSFLVPVRVDVITRVRHAFGIFGIRLAEAFTRIGVSTYITSAFYSLPVVGRQRLRARIEQVEVDQLRKNVSDFQEMLESLCELIIIDTVDEIDRLDDS